jgi:SAM-dependent methyltransferase
VKRSMQPENSITNGQSSLSLRANRDFFLKNIESYKQKVETIDSYRLIREHITSLVSGADRMLDIGNGGVFAYDSERVREIIALDLFFDQLPADVLRAHFPPNCNPRAGSALNIPEPNGSFNTVLMVMLIHHLVGNSWQDSWLNARTAFREAARVLRPGGRFILIESCVPPWFFALEKVVFKLSAKVIEHISSHPATMQYPVIMIEQELANLFSNVEVRNIPRGRYLLHYGIKVPSFVTPAAPYSFVGYKA